MEQAIEIATLSTLLTHTRFLLTLRSSEGVYKSLLLFRLSSSSTSTSTLDDSDPLLNPDIRHEHAEGRHDLQGDGNENGDELGGHQLYAMNASCPHLGADLSHAEIEECEQSVVAVCPWHRYDFDLRTGESDTGLRACTYNVSVQRGSVWIEPPSIEEGTGWRIVELRPVSEEFADPPPPPATLPSISSLSLSDSSSKEQEEIEPTNPPKTLIGWAVLILSTSNPQLKVARTRHAVRLFRTGQLALGNKRPHRAADGVNACKVDDKEMGEKEKWDLLKPPDMPPREGGMKMTDPGHAPKRKSRIAMLHALANIEQWAIDLAWDIIARFGPAHPELPHQFYSDFTKVALDESKHFTLLCARLDALGSYYGSLSVHAGLWQSATETAHSLKSRLAIIHLVHEARGLDVNPATIERFRRQGDKESVDTLEIIHHDEITHVTAGHRWFTWLCKREEVDPVVMFREEVRAHFVGALKGPFNVGDREKAGMGREYYEDLKGEADLMPTKHVEPAVGVAYE